MIRRGSRWTLAVLAALALGGVVPASVRPVAAQEEPGRAQAELEYEAALKSYEAAVAAWEAVARRYGDALSRVITAQRAADDDRYEQAQRRFYGEAEELERADQRVRVTGEALEEARRALLRALDRERERLEEELERARTPLEEQDVRARLRDILNQYRELEGQTTGGMPFTDLVFYPALEIDPRDSRADIEAKADLHVRKAEEADAQIELLEQEIDRLEARIRLQRREEDFSANLDRFDDTRLPVSPPRTTSANDEEVPTDSTRTDRPMTLPERLEQLRSQKTRLEAYRDQMLATARRFRERIGGIS